MPFLQGNPLQTAPRQDNQPKLIILIHFNLTMPAGKLFDSTGVPMSPTFAHGPGGRLYRYYVSATLQQQGSSAGEGNGPQRVSATVIERYLEQALSNQEKCHVHTVGSPLDRIRRAELHPDRLIVTLTPDDPRANPSDGRIILPFTVSTGSGRTRITNGDRLGPRRDPILIRALRSAHAMLARDAAGLPTLDAAPLGPHRNRILRLAFLAPDLQNAILTGRHPNNLSLAALLTDDIPLLWRDQHARLSPNGPSGSDTIHLFRTPTA